MLLCRRSRVGAPFTERSLELVFSRERRGELALPVRRQRGAGTVVAGLAGVDVR